MKVIDIILLFLFLVLRKVVNKFYWNYKIVVFGIGWNVEKNKWKIIDRFLFVMFFFYNIIFVYLGK